MKATIKLDGKVQPAAINIAYNSKQTVEKVKRQVASSTGVAQKSLEVSIVGGGRLQDGQRLYDFRGRDLFVENVQRFCFSACMY